MTRRGLALPAAGLWRPAQATPSGHSSRSRWEFATASREQSREGAPEEAPGRAGLPVGAPRVLLCFLFCPLGFTWFVRDCGALGVAFEFVRARAPREAQAADLVEGWPWASCVVLLKKKVVWN